MDLAVIAGICRLALSDGWGLEVWRRQKGGSPESNRREMGEVRPEIVIMGSSM